MHTCMLLGMGDGVGTHMNNVAVTVDGQRCGLVTHAKRKNTVRCGCKSGRRVRVKTLAKSYLTLCEVRVFGS